MSTVLPWRRETADLAFPFQRRFTSARGLETIFCDARIRLPAGHTSTLPLRLLYFNRFVGAPIIGSGALVGGDANAAGIAGSPGICSGNPPVHGTLSFECRVGYHNPDPYGDRDIVVFDSESADTFYCKIVPDGDWIVVEWSFGDASADQTAGSGLVRFVLDAGRLATYESDFSTRLPVIMRDDEDGWFIESAVTGPVPKLNTVIVAGRPIDGDIDLEVGWNTTFDESEPDLESTRPRVPIAVGAAAGSGLGRYPDCNATEIRLLGGVGPDDRGNVTLTGDGCYWFELPGSRVGEEFVRSDPHKLLMHGACGPCCKCEDYWEAYELVRTINRRLDQGNTRLASARSIYERTRAEFLAVCPGPPRLTVPYLTYVLIGMTGYVVNVVITFRNRPRNAPPLGARPFRVELYLSTTGHSADITNNPLCANTGKYFEPVPVSFQASASIRQTFERFDMQRQPTSPAYGDQWDVGEIVYDTNPDNYGVVRLETWYLGDFQPGDSLDLSPRGRRGVAMAGTIMPGEWVTAAAQFFLPGFDIYAPDLPPGTLVNWKQWLAGDPSRIFEIFGLTLAVVLDDSTIFPPGAGSLPEYIGVWTPNYRTELPRPVNRTR